MTIPLYQPGDRKTLRLTLTASQWDSLATACLATPHTLEQFVEAIVRDAAERLGDATDWQAFAQDYLSGDPERLRKHLPEWLRDLADAEGVSEGEGVRSELGNTPRQEPSKRVPAPSLTSPVDTARPADGNALEQGSDVTQGAAR